MTEAITYEFAFGTYEQALAMVGHRSQPRHAPAAVCGSRIRLFAAMIRDANRSYWDERFAERAWGGLLAPPALLMGWVIPPPWQPSGAPPVPSVAIRVPLPGTTFINASNEAEFFDPIMEGDLLTAIEEVEAVSSLKQTKLGAGHFVTTVETYYRGHDERVAINRNTLFRFSPQPRP